MMADIFQQHAVENNMFMTLCVINEIYMFVPHRLHNINI